MEVGDVVSARAGDLGWKYINASNVYSKTKCKGNAFSKQKFLGCYSSAFSKLWMLDNSSSSSLCWSADKVFSSMPRAASCCWTAVTDSDSGSVDATDTKELALPISLAGAPIRICRRGWGSCWGGCRGRCCGGWGICWARGSCWCGWGLWVFRGILNIILSKSCLKLLLSPPCPFQLLRLPKLAEICNLAEQLANLGVLAGKVSGRFGIYACFVFSKGLSNISFKKIWWKVWNPCPEASVPSCWCPAVCGNWTYKGVANPKHHSNCPSSGWRCHASSSCRVTAPAPGVHGEGFGQIGWVP